MKKKYVAPYLEFEEYALDMSIASNCSTIITPGPQMYPHTMCDGYDGPDDLNDDVSRMFSIKEKNLSFYEDTCDCYTTGGGNIYWTS